MYKWYTVLILLSVLNFSACNTENTTHKNDLIEKNLNGKVKSLKKIGYYVIEENDVVKKGNKYEGRFEEIYLFNKDGNVTETKQIKSNGDLYNIHLFKYNEKGILIESEWYSEFGKETVSIYKYDKQGYKIEWDINNIDGSLSQKYTYKYDDKGNQIESNWYNTGDSSPITSVFTYDDKGNRIVDSYINSDGSVYDRTNYKFDDKGNVIERGEYELSFYFIYKFQREFDDKGNVTRTERIKVDDNDKLLRKSLETFKYDFNNNWIERIVYENENPELIEERIIEYYE